MKKHTNPKERGYVQANSVIHGDCLEVMQRIKPESIDMILCDLPYGTTQNKWDSVIPFNELWLQYLRIIKPTGNIILTAQPPFDKSLATSCMKHFKYEWIWEKTIATGHLNSKKQPLKSHENILVFYKSPGTYNPQMVVGLKPSNKSSAKKSESSSENYGNFKDFQRGGNLLRFPRSVIKFNTANHEGNAGLHPTQKPVSLFSYLIKTYSNAGDLILDNCAGSGTTGEACLETGRNFILIEKEEKYAKVIEKRISSVKQKIAERLF